MSQRCLAAAGRSEKDDRAEPIGLQQAAQQLPGAQEVFLPEKLLQGPWPHACGEGLGPTPLGLVGGIEEP
jgi:hypothetical protein